MRSLNWMTPRTAGKVAAEPASRPAVKRKSLRRRAVGVLFKLTSTFLTLAVMAGLVYAYSNGYRMVTVHGGSMGDTIPVGSVVIGKLRDPQDIHLDDVILVREQHDDGTVASPKIHRVIDLHLRDGVIAVRTKGDSNPEPDPDEYYLGGKTLVAQEHIPRLGYWIGFAATPAGWALTVLVPFTTTACIGMLSIWRRKPAAASAR